MTIGSWKISLAEDNVGGRRNLGIFIPWFFSTCDGDMHVVGEEIRKCPLGIGEKRG